MSSNIFFSTQTNTWQNSSSNTWIGTSVVNTITERINALSIQQYSQTAYIYKDNVQEYSQYTEILNVNTQPYELISPIYGISEQQYMDVSVVSSIYELLYTDVEILYAVNKAQYADCGILYSSSVFKYNIFCDIKRAFTFTYTVANEPIYTSAVLIYSIANLPVYTISVQKYKIPLQSSFISKYRINTPISTKFVSSYNILNYQPVSKSFIGAYTFSQSGLLGISERAVGCYKPWQQYFSERNIHLHLFNTFYSNRCAVYNRYYSLYSTITCLVSRQIISDDRTCFYEVYEEKTSQRNLRYSSYDTFTDERTSHFARFGIFSDERKGFMAAILQGVSSERAGFLRPIYNTYRYCYTKSWHVSEIWCITHAKEKDRLGTQRYVLCETEQRRFASIRNIMFDVCCISYPIHINPEYNTCAFKIGYSDGFVGSGSGSINDSVGSNYPGPILFEKIKVVPDNNALYTLPINFDLNKIDMLLLDKGSNTPVYCAKHSLINIKFNKVSTNTYRYIGHIIPLQQTMMLKVIYSFLNKGTLTDEEYFLELEKHGYFKVVINGEAMSINETVVVDVPATSLISFTIDMLESELLSDNINIKLMWAYPYTEVRTNYITLYGTT